MVVKRKHIDKLNEVIYRDLNLILKKLDKKLYLKIYCILPKTKNKPYKIKRIKKTLDNGFIHEELNDIYKELNIESFRIDNEIFDYNSLKEKIDTQYFQSHSNSAIKNEFGEYSKLNNKSRGYESFFSHDLIYVNQLSFFKKPTSYILMIRNVENTNQEIFYNNPEISFLRMLLDYFFLDYYTTDLSNNIKINNIRASIISQKYNEDCTQYNRRIARLYFGKIQTFIESPKLKSESLNSINSQFYVNNLLESLDDISSRAYESSIAFGSILFMNKELIIESDLIRFAIRFAKHDVIKLEDAKRIRKLLELTNIEKDLYLIADHNVIYGIGEVNWHLQKDFLILRLDFHGVSKYILSFAKLKMQSILEGQLITKENQKFYRSDLKLEEKELISITFKNPKINEEGYSIERFSRILSKELFENKEEQIKIEKLNEIVQKARMQKHGTIVVFTNFETAKNEIKKLSKQSTVIEVGPINPEHIEFLTSIDGAIYFDSDCNCHGIGVILDGEAQENIGDASRGARFNSAYRYIAKLKKSGQKCVIIIISEDGMIDVLPEFEDEDKLLEITEEIIDLIKEGKENNEEMTEKELKLLGSSLVDNEWLFKIAQTYYDLNNYKKANKYYTRAIELGEKVFIDADYYFNASINAYLLAYTEESSDIYIYSTKLAFEFITKLNEEENKCYGYYILALCYIEITKLKMKNRNKQEELVNDLKQTLFFAEKVLENPKKINNENSSAVYKKIGDIYYKLINIEKLEDEYFLTEALKCYSISIQLYENYFNYYAQGLTYKKLKNIKKALKSFITSAFFKESEEHFKAILDEVDLILKKNNKVIKAARSFYDECANSKFKIQKLDTLILDYENKE